MAIEMDVQPTLLVGVGGTGSRIADRILKQVRQNNDVLGPGIRMLAVDTDEGDLEKLTDVPKDSRIRISEPEFVYRTLQRNAGVMDQWCYRDTDNEMTEDIKGKSLIVGAGQIRMLTRLALHDRLTHGHIMETMEAAISRLAVHSEGLSEQKGVRIIMICSLGGATGSGSFIQLALVLRKAAENRGVLPMMRGLVLLPDIFNRSGKISQDEWDDLLSNGYAAMKELNAVNLRADLRDFPDDFTFEYAPGHFAGIGTKPFEEVVFIDYENSVGGSMGQNLDAYVNMAARSAYLNIFTPLGPKIASQSINRSRTSQRNLSDRQLSSYSGIGIAGLEYPVESTKRYLSRRLVFENLKGDWSRLDLAFREQVARHKKDAAAGLTSAEEPNQRDSFLRDFAQLAKEDPPIPFFRRCHDQLFPVIEDPATYQKTEKPLHKGYVDALLDYVKRQFWDDAEMKRIRQRSPMDETSLLESDSIVDTVRREEYTLDRDWAGLEAALQQRPADIFQNALISADSAGQEEWAPHHLQRYVVGAGLHPVAVRAFLYHVHAEIEARAAALDPRERRRKLFILANAFRSEEELQQGGATPNKRSTPGVIEAATAAEQGGGVMGMFQRKKKAYAEDYAAYYNRSITMIRGYGDETIEAKVLDQAMAEVSGLIRTFQGLFDEIEKIGGTLATAIEKEITPYETKGGVFTGNTFVYANRLCKEDAWRRLNDATTGLAIEGSVNRELAREVFDKHRADRRDRVVTGFGALRDLFHRAVVVGFGEVTVARDYTSIYEMNVIDAIRAQFRVEAADAAARGAPLDVTEAQYLKRLVSRISNQSLPYVSLRQPDSDGTPLKFWTMHPDCREAIPDDAEFIDLFQSEISGEDTLIAPQFPATELTCANYRVNLQLQNLSKLAIARPDAVGSALAESDGRMTRAYNAHLAKMSDPARAGREGAEITPHVDKTWHLPGALPELHAELGERIAADKAKSFVAAAALGLIRYETDGSYKTARLATRGHGVKDGVDMALADSHDPWVVYKAMSKNAASIRSVLAVWDRKGRTAAAEARSHPLFAALSDPKTLMAFFRISAIRNDAADSRDAATRAMAVAWIDLLRDVVERQESAVSPRARADLTTQTVDAARAAFFQLVEAEQYGAEVSTAFERVFGEAYDDVFAE